MVKMIARRIDSARIIGGAILSAVSCQHASEGSDLKCSAGGRNGAKLTAGFKDWLEMWR